jgi:hypothetical protein
VEQYVCEAAVHSKETASRQLAPAAGIAPGIELLNRYVDEPVLSRRHCALTYAIPYAQTMWGSAGELNMTIQP